jgi:hypothetical protein
VLKKKQRRHIKFCESMGILSGQIWYINSPLWHMLNWKVKQMKKGLLFSQKQTEMIFTMEPDVFTAAKNKKLPL